VSAVYDFDVESFAPYQRRATGKNVIVLHGALAAEFGDRHEYVVNTPREAIRALCCNKPGFAERIKPMELKVVRVRRGAGKPLELDENDIHMRMSQDTDIWVMPVPAGSKKSGVGKVILGIVLVAATIFTAGAASPGLAMFGAGGALSATAALGVSYGTIALFGVSLALGGLAMMLAPAPGSIDPNAREDDKASFLFNGVVNVQEQGHPEPLVYGRFRVGSVVIGSSIVDEQVMTGAGSYDGNGHEGTNPGFGSGLSSVDGGFQDFIDASSLGRWLPDIIEIGPVTI